MEGVVLTAEVILAVLILAALLFVLVTLLRRRLIARDRELMLSVLRLGGGGRWRSGLLRLSPGALEWYPLFGIIPRVTHSWPRRRLDIDRFDEVANPMSPGGAPAVRMSFSSECRREQHAGVEAVEVVVSREAYTALRAWVEAAPPSEIT